MYLGRGQVARALSLCLLLCLLPAACSGGKPGGPAASTATLTPASGDISTLTLIDSTGRQHSLSIEIADTTQERSAGLSNRQSLAAGTGMLFVFDLSQRGLGFWMKDTSIPLSVAFIDRCGAITDIQDMQPESLDLHQAAGVYAFGLEVNQGWFAQNGIRTGDKVEIPAEYQYPDCS
jgi:uncharacterized membrane protein (UPF0127 family)